VPTCIVEGDIVFSEGQEIRKTGIFCINENSYVGHNEICRENGAIDRIETSFTCPAGTVCVQCGEFSRRGGATCQSNPSIFDGVDCDFPEDYKDDGCLLGLNNEAFAAGEITEQPSKIGCQDQTSFLQFTGVCGENGYVDYRYETVSCPESTTCEEQNDGTVECVATASTSLLFGLEPQNFRNNWEILFLGSQKNNKKGSQENNEAVNKPTWVNRWKQWGP